MDAEIRYLYHSGFAVKTRQHFFIFDYYIDTPRGCGLDKGVIDPEEIREQDVVVFSSHIHSDHFNPKIFSWKQDVPKIRYVLSDDIRTTQDALKVHAGMTYDLGDLSFRVLDSTDAGVAFLIYADGLCIYHAGDLNDWYWNGEPDADNAEMTRRYREQIDTLKGEKIDIAFVPVDPRLEENYLRGLDYLMKTAEVGLAVPMHFGDNLSVFEQLRRDPRADTYRVRTAFFSRRGDQIPYSRSEI